MEKTIEVKIIGMILDPISKTPVMILKPLNEKKIIPIWVGTHEANAITMELENILAPRPMTHDLLHTIIKQLDGKVERIVINDIVENTYYANLYISQGTETKVIDCRPSDAIAIALKNQCKIYISEYVYTTSIFSDFFTNICNSEERLESWFNSLSSEDFGSIEQ
jgi:bifunctional DNase/RNase